MKRISVIITILILVIYAYSCGKDHEAPTFSQFDMVKKPTNVVATYNKAANTFTVTWDMQNTTDVIDYYVSIADSADFESITTTRTVGNTATTCTITKASDLVPAKENTAIRYFAVSAIYSNENVKSFVGPRSDVADTALFVR